ncbi:hypothetical protein GEV33_001873 [Tenebrio molitor]|uniref:Uncharacterized protein n=1 Tax=Tenebrio molitor TaxID=7067 RepID=A0A8J6HVH8_TENMO|nr:hypothetical protein GEV33_001873 [Tenebrio molitor]
MRQLWRPPHGELPRLPQVPKRISGQENPPGNPTKPPEKSHRILHELADAIDLLVEAPPEPTYHDPRGHHADTLDIALLKNVPLQTRLHVVNALNLDHLPVLIHIGDETNDENLNTQVQCTNWPLKLNSKPGALLSELAPPSTLRRQTGLATKSNTRSSIIGMIDGNGNSNRKPIPLIHGTLGLDFSNDEKAEAFADSLELQCKANIVDADLDHIELIERRVKNILSGQHDTPITPTSPEEVRGIIGLLKVKKAPGPDKIPNTSLKLLPDKVVVALTAITLVNKDIFSYILLRVPYHVKNFEKFSLLIFVQLVGETEVS